MQTAVSDAEYSARPEDVIRRLRNGETQLRDFLLEYYWNYILSIVTRMIGRPAGSTDEFSVGLQAFNEAIDRFDENKNVSFLYYAGLVINRRVIDYIRQHRRYKAEYPFTYFEAKDDENYLDKVISEQPDLLTDRLEIQEEILSFKKELLSFGITFDDLVRLAPKHLDTKLLCLSAAKRLSLSKDLSDQLNNEKKLPVRELMEAFHLNRKTVENHRKYIIALYLVLNSDMEIIKGYGNFLLKRSE